MLLSPKSALLRWHGGISHEQKEFRGTEKRKQPTENHIFRINYGTVIFSRIVYHDYFKGKPDLLSRIGSGILIFSYVLMNSVMQLQYQKLREEKEEHEGLLKSEKASYLIIKKSFDEVFQRMDYIEKNLQLPTEEL